MVDLHVSGSSAHPCPFGGTGESQERVGRWYANGCGIPSRWRTPMAGMSVPTGAPQVVQVGGPSALNAWSAVGQW